MGQRIPGTSIEFLDWGEVDRRIEEHTGPKRGPDVPVKKLRESLGTWDWLGRRCWIIGGGPSLKGFDFSVLRGELTIGINKAFGYCNPTVIYSGDYRFYKKLTMRNYPKRERLWPDDEEKCMAAKKLYEQSNAYKVWLDTEDGAFGPEVQVVDYAGNKKEPWKTEPNISLSLERGCYSGGNSGFSALNLALCLGADPIILLGYDMLGRDGKPAWFHDGYEGLSSWQRMASCYDKFRSNFEKAFALPQNAEYAKSIRNFSHDSSLDIFEYPAPEEVKIFSRPLFVSYYTNDLYLNHLRDLEQSLHRHACEYESFYIGDAGSWQENTKAKAQFILDRMYTSRSRDLVWLDADAHIEKFPDFFNEYALRDDVEIAFHRRRNRVLSGTLFIKNTDRMRELVRDWVEQNQRHPEMWEQRNLEAVLDYWIQERALQYKKLPASYCHIFDAKDQGKFEDAVITHWQASREQKRMEQGYE